MRRRFTFVCSFVAVSLLALSFAPYSVSAKSSSAAKSAAASPGSPDAAVRARVAELKGDVLAANSKAAASLFSDDARYVDEYGVSYNGRTALEKMFADTFQGNAKPQVDLVVNSVKFPASNVALVDGTVQSSAAAKPASVPLNRFSLVLQQKDGTWQIAQALETPIAGGMVPAGNPLTKLNWLIGEWNAKRDDAQVHMRAEWVPSKQFILCSYNIQKPGQPEQHELQVIGWDPRTQQPTSWHFTSGGGFGESHWQKTGGQWLISSEAVQRNGSDMTSINVISQDSPNSFTWQAVNRRLDGTLIEDTQPVLVQRAGTNTASK